jgi:phosphoserine phosphatase RsbU/P
VSGAGPGEGHPDGLEPRGQCRSVRPATSEILVEVEGLDSEIVELFVHDEGKIPAETLNDLFSPFRRHRAKNSRGLGLGLFITKEIVRAHGGTIDGMSSMPDGTTFRVRLPRSSTVLRRETRSS